MNNLDGLYFLHMIKLEIFFSISDLISDNNCNSLLLSTSTTPITSLSINNEKINNIEETNNIGKEFVVKLNMVYLYIVIIYHAIISDLVSNFSKLFFYTKLMH